MASGEKQAAGCVVWCGLVGGGAAVGVLLVVAAEFIWPTRVADGGPLAGAGVIGEVLGRAALCGFIGAVIGGAAARWAVWRLRRGQRADPG